MCQWRGRHTTICSINLQAHLAPLAHQLMGYRRRQPIQPQPFLCFFFLPMPTPFLRHNPLNASSEPTSVART